MDRVNGFPKAWGEKVDGILYLNIGSDISSYVPSGRKIEVNYDCKNCGAKTTFLYSEEEFLAIFPYFVCNYPHPLGLQIDYKPTRKLFAIRNLICDRCVIHHDFMRYVKDTPTYSGIDLMLNGSGLTEHFDGVISGYSSEIEDVDIIADRDRFEKKLEKEHNEFKNECDGIERSELRKHFPDHPDWYSKSHDD